MTFRQLRDAIDGLGLDAAEHQPAVYLDEEFKPSVFEVELVIAEADILDSFGNVLISEGNFYLREERD